MIEQDKIFHSQSGQDKFLYKYFFKKYDKPGFFIELGALDGVLISNTLFYEKILGWDGICIEPTTHHFDKLLTTRNCYKFNDVIYDVEKNITFLESTSCCDSLNGIKETYDKNHINRIYKEIIEYGQDIKDVKETIIKARTLDSILIEVDIKHIDLLSLDTEGSELNVLKSINWNTTTISVICVEDNYGNQDLHNFLKSLNYILFHRLEGDFIYYHPDLIKPIIS